MSFAYYKIDNIIQTRCELYYKKPIDIAIHKASVMDSKHFYYYKSPHTTEYRQLGQFNALSKRSSNCRYNDYDYDVYEFTYDYISCSEKDNIYCIGIPESGEKMVEMIGMFYQEYQVYMLSK